MNICGLIHFYWSFFWLEGLVILKLICENWFRHIKTNCYRCVVTVQQWRTYSWSIGWEANSLRRNSEEGRWENLQTGLGENGEQTGTNHWWPRRHTSNHIRNQTTGTARGWTATLLVPVISRIQRKLVHKYNNILDESDTEDFLSFVMGIIGLCETCNLFRQDVFHQILTNLSTHEFLSISLGVIPHVINWTFLFHCALFMTSL